MTTSGIARVTKTSNGTALLLRVMTWLSCVNAVYFHDYNVINFFVINRDDYFSKQVMIVLLTPVYSAHTFMFTYLLTYLQS